MIVVIIVVIKLLLQLKVESDCTSTTIQIIIKYYEGEKVVLQIFVL